MSNIYHASTTIDDINKDYCLCGNIRVCNIPSSTVLAFIITIIGMTFAILGIVFLSGAFGIASYSLLTGLVAFWIPSPAFNTSKTVTQLIPTTESSVQNAVERAAMRQSNFLATHNTVGSTPLPFQIGNDVNTSRYSQNISSSITQPPPVTSQQAPLPSMTYGYRPSEV